MKRCAAIASAKRATKKRKKEEEETKTKRKTKKQTLHFQCKTCQSKTDMEGAVVCESCVLFSPTRCAHCNKQPNRLIRVIEEFRWEEFNDIYKRPHTWDDFSHVTSQTKEYPHGVECYQRFVYKDDPWTENRRRRRDYSAWYISPNLGGKANCIRVVSYCYPCMLSYVSEVGPSVWNQFHKPVVSWVLAWSTLYENHEEYVHATHQVSTIVAQTLWPNGRMSELVRLIVEEFAGLTTPPTILNTM